MFSTVATSDVSAASTVTAVMTSSVAVTTMMVAPLPNTIANHAEKPEKFNGVNFKR